MPEVMAQRNSARSLDSITLANLSTLVGYSNVMARYDPNKNSIVVLETEKGLYLCLQWGEKQRNFYYGNSNSNYTYEQFSAQYGTILNKKYFKPEHNLASPVQRPDVGRIAHPEAVSDSLFISHRRNLLNLSVIDPIAGGQTTVMEVISRLAEKSGSPEDYKRKIRPLFSMLDEYFGANGKFPNSEVYAKAAILLLYTQKVACPDGADLFFSGTNAAKNILHMAIDSEKTITYLKWFYYAAWNSMKFIKNAENGAQGMSSSYHAGGTDCDWAVHQITESNPVDLNMGIDEFKKYGLPGCVRVNRTSYGHWAFAGAPYVDEDGRRYYVLGATRVRNRTGWREVNRMVWHFYRGSTLDSDGDFNSFISRWNERGTPTAGLSIVSFGQFVDRVERGIISLADTIKGLFD